LGIPPLQDSSEIGLGLVDDDNDDITNLFEFIISIRQAQSNV
jgi:hypothetical protein